MESIPNYQHVSDKIGDSRKMPVFFHPAQLEFKPLYEWALGKRIKHPETTQRAESILSAIKKHKKAFEVFTPQAISSHHLRETHDYQLMTLYHTANLLPENQTFYPTVFPNKRIAQPDPTNIYHAGYFCFDVGTPLNSQTYAAASWSASCAFDAASVVAEGIAPLAYALSRPPGHHASEALFGGYCYFNNAAIACQRLRENGKRIAILDIDFHHGNGTQDLFYHTDQVLTISLHGDPRTCFPYYSGYSHETGSREGQGYNLNFPLPKGTEFADYRKLIEGRILGDIRSFAPDYLIICAGFDTYKKDPVGDFNFETQDFFSLGEILASLDYPTVVVQEGGYYTPDLGENVVHFLNGMRQGYDTRSQPRQADATAAPVPEVIARPSQTGKASRAKKQA